MEDNNVNETDNLKYYSNRFLYKYQIIDEDVGSDGMVIWYIENYVISDSHGNLWLEEIEYNKNCVLNNTYTKTTPLVKLERND